MSQGFRRALEGAGALLETALARMGAADWLRAMMVEGVWAGVGCVLSFLPTILTLFFLLSLLEDSGYMARMAFVADRALRRLGLTGRSLARRCWALAVRCRPSWPRARCLPGATGS